MEDGGSSMQGHTPRLHISRASGGHRRRHRGSRREATSTSSNEMGEEGSEEDDEMSEEGVGHSSRVRRSGRHYSSRHSRHSRHHKHHHKEHSRRSSSPIDYSVVP